MDWSYSDSCARRKAQNDLARTKMLLRLYGKGISLLLSLTCALAVKLVAMVFYIS